MNGPARFPFLQKPNGNGPHDLQPLLPFSLSSGSVSLQLRGLVDSGASISILPLHVGQQFGIPWGTIAQSIQIGGAFSPATAKMLYLHSTIQPFPTVKLAFAWVNSNNYPVVLGIADFLFHFDVFLSRRHSYFEIQPATP